MFLGITARPRRARPVNIVNLSLPFLGINEYSTGFIIQVRARFRAEAAKKRRKMSGPTENVMNQRAHGMVLRSPRIVMAMLVTAGLVSGCSWTPDWANPVEWYKGTRDWIAGDDGQAGDARARDSQKQQSAPAGSAPNLATVPERPRDIASVPQANAVQQGLVADRTQARHAALGPGDGAMSRVDPGAAPPPVVVSPPPPSRAASAAPAPKQAEAPPPPAPAPYAPNAAASAAPAPAPAPASAPVMAQDSDGVRAAFQAALNQSAATVTTAPAGLRDMTASNVPMTAQRGTMPLPPAPRDTITLRAPPSAAPVSMNGSGQPGGASVSIQAGTVLFGNGSSKLSKDDIKIIENAVKLKKEKGGSLRVVGHASSRTRDVDPLRHRLVNFRLSLARANAVARALSRRGVPASEVRIQAMSDNAPLYHEFMPAGEAGNRRAEIYLDY
jgi:outer membrane protein OmpA-like peptidoglycan-associated protein